MGQRVRGNLKYLAYIVVAIAILYGGDTAAQAKMQTEILDLTFWFRTLLAAMLGVLIWIAKNSEGRLKEVEKDVGALKTTKAERGQTLAAHNGRLLWLENETKQRATQLDTLEKILIKNYHDKNETNEHRGRVEAQLTTISHRLDTLARPHHRQSDDRNDGHG